MACSSVLSVRNGIHALTPEGPCLVFPIVPHNLVSMFGRVLRPRRITGEVDEPITLSNRSYLVVDNLRLLLMHNDLLCSCPDAAASKALSNEGLLRLWWLETSFMSL